MLIPVKSLEPFLAHNEDPIYVSFYSCFCCCVDDDDFLL